MESWHPVLFACLLTTDLTVECNCCCCISLLFPRRISYLLILLTAGAPFGVQDCVSLWGISTRGRSFNRDSFPHSLMTKQICCECAVAAVATVGIVAAGGGAGVVAAAGATAVGLAIAKAACCMGLFCL